MPRHAIIFVGPGGKRLSTLAGALDHVNCQQTETTRETVVAEAIEKRQADVVVLVCGAGSNWSGIEVLGRLRAIDRLRPMLIFTGESSERFLLGALRSGASDVLPIAAESAEIFEALERVGIGRETPAGPGRGAVDGARLVGDSAKVRDIRMRVQRVAQTDSDVLITGETGTGKEVTAELIHLESRRRKQPFVSINCAAIPETLLESELFGYERGAFTGARESKEGRLESADGGTVFLDEIGDMDLVAQAKILRAIESRNVSPLGGNRKVALDVRIVAASNQNLEDLVQTRKFRQDLYYRVNVARIHLPPLRERPQDIPGLVAHFLELLGRRSFSPPLSVDQDAMRTLQAYDWPGNVRELRNLVESAIVFHTGNQITIEDLPSHVRCPLKDGAETTERSRILDALTSVEWNKSEAARILHCSRMTLYRKMTRFRIVSVA